MKKKSPHPLRLTSLALELKEVALDGGPPKLEHLLKLERQLYGDGKNKKAKLVTALIKFMLSIPMTPDDNGCWIWEKDHKIRMGANLCLTPNSNQNSPWNTESNESNSADCGYASMRVVRMWSEYCSRRECLARNSRHGS